MCRPNEKLPKDSHASPSDNECFKHVAFIQPNDSFKLAYEAIAPYFPHRCDTSQYVKSILSLQYKIICDKYYGNWIYYYESQKSNKLSYKHVWIVFLPNLSHFVYNRYIRTSPLCWIIWCRAFPNCGWSGYNALYLNLGLNVMFVFIVV